MNLLHLFVQIFPESCFGFGRKPSSFGIPKSGRLVQAQHSQRHDRGGADLERLTFQCDLFTSAYSSQIFFVSAVPTSPADGRGQGRGLPQVLRIPDTDPGVTTQLVRRSIHHKHSMIFNFVLLKLSPRMGTVWICAAGWAGLSFTDQREVLDGMVEDLL